MKLKKLALFLVLFCLFVSLATAVSITTPQTDYSVSQPVSISISDCSGRSVLDIQNAHSSLIGVEEGLSTWSTIYHTSSDPSKGKYTLTIKCVDGTTATTNFCVDSPGCTQPAATPPSTGGGSCTSQWQCSQWSACSAEGNQTRICQDTRCHRKDKIESRACVCNPSWVCSAWSACLNGQQTRGCVDEANCDSQLNKPTLQQTCATSAPPPVQTSPPTYTPPVVQSPEPTFWDQYGIWLISLLALLILIGIVIFLLVHHYHQPHHEVINHDELVLWVQKELQAGISVEQLRQAVQQQTTWTDQEFNRALTLVQKSLSQQPTTNN